MWAYAIVNAEWHPRFSAIFRVYTYIDSYKYYHDRLDELLKIIELFRGTKNFKCFSKVEPYQEPFRRVLDFQVLILPKYIAFMVVAESFLRQMVRRIISSIRAFVRGKLGIHHIIKAFNGECHMVRSLPLAKAENLILLNIRYPFSFRLHRFGFEEVTRYLKMFREVNVFEFLLNLLPHYLYELL